MPEVGELQVLPDDLLGSRGSTEGNLIALELQLLRVEKRSELREQYIGEGLLMDFQDPLHLISWIESDEDSPYLFQLGLVVAETFHYPVLLFDLFLYWLDLVSQLDVCQLQWIVRVL